MKMYNSALSPYAARCRVQIYAKGLDVELIDYPTGVTPEELARLSPIAKVPVLQNGDLIIPESQVICEYLEEACEGPSLRPDDPAALARVRLLARITDLYIMAPLGQLFGQINPAGRDPHIVDKGLTDLTKGLEWLNAYLDGVKYAVGGSLSLADCALMPTLFFVTQVGPMFGRADLISSFGKIHGYYEASLTDPHIARVVGEVADALKKMQS